MVRPLGVTATPRAAELARSLLDLVSVDDPRISPDGTEVAWIETRIDRARDGTDASLKIASFDLSGAPEVRVEGHAVARPRWSPDGSELAMIVRDPTGGGSRIASVARAGGPLRWWGDPDGEVVDLAWRPDGGGLAIVVLRRSEASLPEGPPGVVRTRRLRWKQDGRGLVGDRWTHLSWLPRDEAAPARPWLHGPYDVTAPAWSPDGTRIAVLASDEADKQVYVSLSKGK